MAARKRSTPSSAKKKAPARRTRKPKRDQMAATGPYPFHEGLAIGLGGIALMLFLALVSYTPFDLPSWVPFSSSSGRETTLTNFIGPVGAVVAGYSYFFFGAASYLIPAVLVWWGIQVLTGARPFHGRNIAALAVLVGSGACLIEYQTAFFQEWPTRYNLPNSAGGFIGYGIGRRVLEEWLVGTVGAFILMSVAYFVSIIIITGLHPFRFAMLVKDRVSERLEERQQLAEAISRGIGIEGLKNAGRFRRYADDEKEAPKKRTKRSRSVKEPEEAAPEPVAEEMELPLEPALPKPKIIDASMPNRKKGAKTGAVKPEEVPVMASQGDFKNYKVPSLALLNYGDDDEEATPTDTGELLALQTMIVDTLATFGVDVSPGDITKGPTITRYELYPSPGLRVNRITSLEADLARATRAERINILAPIPGKDTVGIEIANSDKVLVALRELFEDDAFSKSKKKIPLALGKDVYGRTIIGDLAQMPHLLVAGATGSGKSVCINSIVASLLYRFTPDQLRFIMIDPKVVEMQLYNKLPHMVVPVVTDPKKVLLALRWVVNEMEKRYAMFAKLGCRNFDGFNARNDEKPARGEKNAPKPDAAAASAKAKAPGGKDIPQIIVEDEEALADPEALLATHPVKISDSVEDPGGNPPQPEMPEPRATAPADPDAAPEEEYPDRLPYIVVIIDELADLMQTAPADVETAIARIAQKARAAGIHLIVATQTPRADVVTGIIKANIPSRIAFQVSSKIDSRVILDAAGADRLVGKGDMLYLPPGSSQLIRAQGALIDDEEIQEVVEYCAKQGEPKFEAEIHETLESGGEGDDEEVSDADEELVERCLEVIYQEKKASTSLLQRRLRLGYTRAARMIDIMEMRGIIGPGDGAKPREILVDLSDDLG